MAQDKKVKRGRLTFILTRGIGQAFIANDVPPENVREFLDASARGLTGAEIRGHSLDRDRPRHYRTALPETDRVGRRFRAPCAGGHCLSRPFEERGFIMARRCELTGKAVLTGNNVSHANNKSQPPLSAQPERCLADQRRA